ncbi:MAG: hypothetical protein ACREQZ_03605 [Woeseiaceae bacterium]
MKLSTKALAPVMLLAVCSYAGSAAAQQSFSALVCRAGTITGIAKAQDLVVFGIDQRGIILADDAAKTFDNNTQRCIGSIAVIRGKSSGGGFCRSVDPASGDTTISEWTSAEKPGTGTFKYLSGTGKWKGITGGGDYHTAAVTRPIDEGTYQNCVRVKGMLSVPKL